MAAKTVSDTEPTETPEKNSLEQIKELSKKILEIELKLLEHMEKLTDTLNRIWAIYDRLYGDEIPGAEPDGDAPGISEPNNLDQKE